MNERKKALDAKKETKSASRLIEPYPNFI